MNQFLKIINKSFGTYNVRGLYIEPTYWQAAAIVILIFLLIFTLARLRYLYLHWHLDRNTVAFFFWGFFLALIIEGFLMISGKTIFIEILGWKNAPKPIAHALDIGRAKLVGVLGENKENSEASDSQKSSYETIISDYQTLQEEEKVLVRKYFCE